VPPLIRLVSLPGTTERHSDAWHLLGEAYKWLNQPKKAEECFKKSIECGGRSAYLARCELAEMAFAAGNLKEAETLSQQNIELISIEAYPEAYERSIFLLGNVLFIEGKYQPATSRFELALDHFRLNPAGSLARFRLAECFRLQAEKESPGQPIGPGTQDRLDRYLHSQRITYLEKAVANYQILINDLDARQHSSSGPLTEEESGLLCLARFNMADCLFTLRNYEQALGIYENLASLYQHQYVGLVACRELYICHLAMLRSRENVQRARRALDRAKSICNELEDGAFKNRPLTRQAWEQWIKHREEELQNLTF